MARGGPVNVLVVEDGHEYTETFARFVGAPFTFTRAGGGASALAALRGTPFDRVFLDMRFDRVPPDALLGDLEPLLARFGGDAVRARSYLEAHQGTYILAAIREAGHSLPAVFSYDFSGEPRRWATLLARYAPLGWIPDNAAPAQIRAALLG